MASKPWEEKWQRTQSLGQGGQGHTFLVVNKEQPAAQGVLKILLPRKANDPRARRRMHQEVTNLTVLHDAGADVPKVLESNTAKFENLESPLYFIMEYVKGKTLAEVVDPHGGVPFEQAIGITQKLCKTMHLAFQEGIVHRDIKPENIVLRDLLMTCSPIPDPRVMRVFEPLKGKEILDEFRSQEASFARAGHRASA